MEGEKKRDASNVQAANNSIAVGEINIGGDVSGNIIIGPPQPPKPSAEELLKKSLQSLKSKKFKEVVNHCDLIIQEHIDHPEANLYSAIALLGGEGADRCSKIQLVEEYLDHVLNEPTTRSIALTIFGIIKYDHYKMNGKPENHQIYENIEKEIGKVKLSVDDRELLSHVRKSKETIKKLRLG